jgi:hypothetical protein
VPKRLLQEDERNNCSSLKVQLDYGAAGLASVGRNRGIRLGTLADARALQLAANMRAGVVGYF